MKNHAFKVTKRKEERPQINLQQQIKVPEKLKLLVLSGSRLATHDFIFIAKCRNIIKLDLSDNQLSFIPIEFNGELLPFLRLLYLHNNNLKEIEDIKPVQKCQQLIHLTIYNNPVQSSQIEHYLLNSIHSLKMINDRIIFEEEKADSLIPIQQPFRLNLEELEAQDQSEESTQEKKHIMKLQRQLFYIKRAWVQKNPLVKLQRRWRVYHKKVISQTKFMKDQTNQNSHYRQNKKLDFCFQKWKQTIRALKTVRQNLRMRNKHYLSQNVIGYCNNIKSQITKKAIIMCMKKLNNQNREMQYARSVINHLRRKATIFHSEQGFYSVSEIQKNHRILFFQNQLSTLNILISQCSSYMKRTAKYQINKCFDYITIRPYEQSPKNPKSLYSIFMAPSMRCIFIKYKDNTNQFTKNKNLIHIRQVSYLQRLSLKMTEDQQIKSMITYENITKYSDSQYKNSLLQFRCQDDDFFKMLLRVICYSNMGIVKPEQTSAPALFDDRSKNFKFYFDKQLQRTCATVSIQKWWRGIKTLKQFKQAPHVVVRNNRSVTLIKHFYRNLEHQHRINFNMRIQKQIKEVIENTLIIQQDVYNNLMNIKSVKQLYPGTRILVSEQNIRITWNFDIVVLSPHVRKLFEGEYPKQKREREGDLYHVLHLGAIVSKLDFRGIRYIKFTYKDPHVARKRIAYFSLLSYNFKHNGFYIRCYQKLITKKQLVLPYYQLLKEIYGITVKQQSQLKQSQQKSLKLQQAVFVFPKRALDFYASQQKFITISTQIDSQFYYKPLKNNPPIKLLQTVYVNLNQFGKHSKENQYRYSKILPTQSIRRNSAPKPQLSLQEIGFFTEIKSQHKKLSPKNIQHAKTQQSIKEEMICKKSRTDIKKQIIFSRKKVLLEHKQREIKKLRKQNTEGLGNYEKAKVGLQLNNHNKVSNLNLENKKRERSLREMRRHTNQFIQKGNSLIKQDILTALIRGDIENSLNKRSQAHSSKCAYQQSISKRKISKSHHSQSYIFEAGQEKVKSKTKRHQRMKTTVQKEIPVYLPRLQQPEGRMSAPPLVHGVFTQQFYAIDKKTDPSLMFKF